MKKIYFILILAMFFGHSALAFDQSLQKTIINDNKAAELLKGDHYFSLQWISWDYYGRVSITEEKGIWRITGRQNARDNADYVSIDGIITVINKRDFKFSGTIFTKVSHINDGKSVERSGDMTFRISGDRRYWRLKEMENPLDNVTDYIDIYFKKY